MKTAKTVEEYIENAPKEAQEKLQHLRQEVKEVCPGASENISYGLMGYKWQGRPLIYFGGHKTHIGIYPTGEKLTGEVKELKKYQTGKGTLQFPLTSPLPMGLIKKLIEIRVQTIEELKR